MSILGIKKAPIRTVKRKYAVRYIMDFQRRMTIELGNMEN
jgi:hypothetical protein